MPDYIAPGVYVEEVSFRSKSIEGVPTGTAGFAGMTRFGPVPYLNGPSGAAPRLIISFVEFEQMYGGLEPLMLGNAGAEVRHVNQMAHAARAFFANGGQRLYVSRVFSGRTGGMPADGVAAQTVAVPGHPSVTWRARWPGALGNVHVSVAAEPTGNAATIELSVTVTAGNGRVDQYARLAVSPDQQRWIGQVLAKDGPEHDNAVVWLDVDKSHFAIAGYAAALAAALQANPRPQLQHGHDGVFATPRELEGQAADPDGPTKAGGLEALGPIDDIAIVALPDAGAYATVDLTADAANRLVAHAEKCRYRMAVIDAPAGCSTTEIRQFRSRFDSAHAALYHPWVEIVDPLWQPLPGTPSDRILLPPSGFIAGIYARSDIERGVHKAPANEVIRGLSGLEANIDRAQQEVLNPEGINVLRFFEGRGHRVWGARTLSADPEWKYVNVRRLLIYLEHSIDQNTQWAVFEPNGDRLWQGMRAAVEDFLFDLWHGGALLGQKPEEAYFVRCDRTTMSQRDLDDGRVICLIGVAHLSPAEFMIFRIGQWTADGKRG